MSPFCASFALDIRTTLKTFTGSCETLPRHTTAHAAASIARPSLGLRAAARRHASHRMVLAPSLAADADIEDLSPAERRAMDLDAASLAASLETVYEEMEADDLLQASLLLNMKERLIWVLLWLHDVASFSFKSNIVSISESNVSHPHSAEASQCTQLLSK